MPLKDLVRGLRDGPLARERWRRAHREAWITSEVLFRGDPARARLGAAVAIKGPTVIAVTDGPGAQEARLEIGPRTYIGEFNNIRCAGAPILIGADCLISQHVTIVGTNHGVAPGSLIVDQPWTGSGVVVGDDVWVGAGAVLLPGARIGAGAVVAANAVVRGSVAPGCIVGGVPARVIGRREVTAT
ncbi:acetyltransferase-like isoleucine patch superfamily enzyme [Kineosphaera limosa]|uniref:Acyltransferase n=1 Tax=Kineosphaera limosa NBRC 100340 TaxID=1184609 RepID=K6X128_9MICO|nr:DapH/DapD/GlmU-related protein [Kineosphaera limosa]NYD99579.1 acetyltransferase-like isoleucine patch superfamily enzyme [Kineosphaera limosa]GAB98077.1 hypothetical protein KILIM_099_00010 [Kineosphaera limosa NBRC 100340]